ncbi:hypothetical protein GCM10027162_63740 [Streptomyces incanus]
MFGPLPASSRCLSHWQRCRFALSRTQRGWEWVAAGWSPPAITKLADWANRDQLALLEELRRRTAPKWWSIYLPRIEKTAKIVRDAPADWSTRRVIATLVCPATCVGRTQAYACRRPENGPRTRVAAIEQSRR